MHFHLSHGRQPLRTQQTLPAHRLKYLVPFSNCIYKLFDEGEFFSQVITGQDHSIWTHHFFIDKPVTLHPESPTNALALNYMLLGNIPCVLNGHGEVLLQQGNYQLFYVPANVRNEARFGPGHYYCVHINFHPSHLEPVAEQFPAFHAMLDKARQQLTNGNSHDAAVITPYIESLIHEIITCDHGVGERKLIIESRIRELLRLYVKNQRKQQLVSALSGPQLQMLRKLEEYIVSNLDEHITVDSLAAATGVGKSWLQSLCKRHYGKAVHELVVEKRMNEASKLLLTTNMPVSNIANRVSDMNFSAFSSAFLKYFGQTPTEYRRTGGQKRQK